MKNNYASSSSRIKYNNVESGSTWFHRVAVISVLASVAACGLTSCSDSSSDVKTCDESLKPSTATHCDCVDGAWAYCIYPEGDKCATSNCPVGQVCDSETGECIKSETPKTCDEASKPADNCTCKEGNWDCPQGTECSGEKPADNCTCKEGNWDCPQVTDCNDDEKPAEAISCDCTNGAWTNCTYPEESKCKDVTCLAGQNCNTEDGKCYYVTDPALEIEVSQAEISENGDIAGVTIKLSGEPSADVTLTLALSGDGKDEAKIRVNGEEATTVTISKDDWQNGVVVEIVAESDDVVDGNKTVSLDITSASDDENFKNLTASATVTLKDENVASIIVEDPEVLETTEDGGEVEFGFRLSSKPASDVTVSLSIDKPEYASINGAKTDGSLDLVFTAENWSEVKTVTVKGKDDGKVLNNPAHTYNLVIADAVSDDEHYNGLATPSIMLTNLDNDSPNILTSKLELREGAKASLDVTLSAAPAADTTITATVTNGSMCKVVSGKDKVTFKADNYNTPQTVEIEVLDDEVHDTTKSCQITLTGSSSDTNENTTYNAKTKVISSSIVDNDTPGLSFNVSYLSLDSIYSPHKVWADEGCMDAITTEFPLCLKLNSKPSAAVTVTFDKINWLKYSASSITIQPDKYNADTNCITIQNVYDLSDEKGKDFYEVNLVARTSSTDSNYKDISKTIKVANDSHATEAYDCMRTGNTLYEATKNTIDYICGLSMKPKKSNIRVDFSIDDPRVTLSKSYVTLNSSNWYKGFKVSLTAQDDSLRNTKDKATLHIEMDDHSYRNYSQDVSFTIVDDETPGIILSCDNTKLFPITGYDYYGYNGVNDSEKITCSVTLTTPSDGMDVSIVGSTQTLTFLSGEVGPKTFTLEYASQRESASSMEPQTITLKAVGSSGYGASIAQFTYTRYPLHRYYYFDRASDTSINLPKGKYRLHAWGAVGGGHNDVVSSSFKYQNHGGAGAYVYGDLTLNEKDTLYITTGEEGKDRDVQSSVRGGGGLGRGGGNDRRGFNGGGATDFRAGKDDDYNRILVAGGGGGSLDPSCKYTGSISYAGGNATWQGTSGHGVNAGQATYTSGSSTLYFAPGGSKDGTYMPTHSFALSRSNFFGRGMSVSECTGGSDGYRRGGGGGGWYGGLAYCGGTKTVSGGAGSSYCFNGTKVGLGQQDAKYALTCGYGSNGGSTSMPWYYLNSSERLVKSTKFGNVGGGYAVIELYF